ncbi:hypothetical protein ACE3NQ_09475 [Paenibacillus terreus]|uniref:Uncharacterized protein n=1 Tax=Paenibacillus terreus TaxID=1387834 RepID=A0ABV5B6Y1_9BACL
MKRKGLLLINLPFLIPAILLSIFVWRDYTDQIANVHNNTFITGLYYMDDGRKVAALTDEQHGMRSRVQMFDAQTGQLLKEETILSNVHGVLAISYQQDGLVITTYDDNLGLQLNVLHPSGEIEELAMGTLQVPSYLTSGVNSWRGKLIITGETSGSAMYVAKVEGGKLQQVMLNQQELLPARPERLDTVSDSFDNEMAVPVIEADLIDDRTAYLSGIWVDRRAPEILIKNEEESSFEARDRAGLQFARHLGLDSTKLIRVDGRYPEQAHFYNASTEQWGKAVPTPKPVYQAKVYLLNDDEVLIAGSSAKDELQGTVLGYLFNEKTGQFTDVTSLLGNLSYEELDHPDLQFFKESESETLYYAGEESTAGMMNLQNHTAHEVTASQVSLWMHAGEDRISPQSFWKYVKQGGPLIINWLVWLFIPLFNLTALAGIPRLLLRKQTQAVANGVILHGTIIQMEETGLLVNNQPQVRFVVRFEDEERMKEVEIKKVISYLERLHVGDAVVISYNRRKNSAVFVTGENMPQKQALDIIHHAVLQRMDSYGSVGRGQALLLHFRANDRHYTVPVVQPAGFEYRVGEQANLALIGGAPRILSYGQKVRFEEAEQLSLEGEIIRIEKYPVTVQNRQLMVMEVMITEGPERIRKINSLFVPRELPVKEGAVIPVSMKRDDYAKELRLLKGKQGAAKVIAVEYTGTLGERPLAHVTVERGGTTYSVHQTIEPVYGVMEGDELWVAYDDSSCEALILNYSF